MTTPLPALAQRIATEAHAGQTDKVGAPYITHPARVAGRLTNEKEVAAAWLHDVLEDCDDWTGDRLSAEGIPTDVITAVEALTRHDGQGDDYYRIVRTNPIALAVKRADIADNTDPERVAALKARDPAKAARLKTKYEHALAVLSGEIE